MWHLGLDLSRDGFYGARATPSRHFYQANLITTVPHAACCSQVHVDELILLCTRGLSPETTRNSRPPKDNVSPATTPRRSPTREPTTRSPGPAGTAPVSFHHVLTPSSSSQTTPMAGTRTPSNSTSPRSLGATRLMFSRFLMERIFFASPSCSGSVSYVIVPRSTPP